MLILETRFDRTEQNVYTIKHNPNVVEPGGMQRVTRINCFFHRMAKDHIKYNVTTMRQFTRHDAAEELGWLDDAKWVKDRVEVEDLNAFFDLIGFDYKAKKYNSGERCKKWNGVKYV